MSPKNILNYHPIYVILLRRKPQLRCYYPILAGDHSDRDPFLCKQIIASENPHFCPAKLSVIAQNVLNPFPVICTNIDSYITVKQEAQ